MMAQITNKQPNAKKRTSIPVNISHPLSFHPSRPILMPGAQQCALFFAGVESSSLVRPGGATLGPFTGRWKIQRREPESSRRSVVSTACDYFAPISLMSSAICLIRLAR